MLYAFDLIEHDGEDLRDLPLIKRKQRLARLIGRAKRAIQSVEHLADEGPTVFDHVCRMGLEGIVSKRVDAPYRNGPSKVWVSRRACAEAGLRVRLHDAAAEDPGRHRLDGVADRGALTCLLPLSRLREREEEFTASALRASLI